ncbi:hypothetical protein [Catellatospora chokoriensis]|uniref:Uncharacterized protein n=1 Tax=Catellatospora chokoriensis TaxID=310353 RepID=A0A8J3K760_9ACTN|nr:hypothetical protein [Catellatospora chokoriensis]GIF94396.1 hypothetical protein Cch02nite_78400 [Catellatospora chokoriensis]
MEPKVDEASGSQLSVLLLDYQMARDDDRSILGVQAAGLSIDITLLGAMIALVGTTCQFGQTANCVRLPNEILAAAPMVPLAIFAFFQMLGTVGTIRGFYLRALETELRKYGNQLSSLPGVAYPSLTGITLEVSSQRRGRAGYRILSNMFLVVVVAAFLVLTIGIGLHVDSRTALVMIVAYGAMLLLFLIELQAATVGGRGLFAYAARKFVRTPVGLPSLDHGAPRDGERSIGSYLLMPRPEDWIKFLNAPGAWLVTYLATGSGDFWRFAVMWISVEYLVFQARYQLNDLRGAPEDDLHSERVARGRLPHGNSQETFRNNLRASAIGIVIRLAVAVVIGVLADELMLMCLFIVAVFGTALIYEGLRAARMVLPVWTFVGVGYAIRAALGIHFAGLSWLDETATLGYLAFAIYGIMFVLLNWASEATSYCTVTPSGEWTYQSGLVDKPHLLALLKPLGIVATLSTRREHAPPNGGHQRVLVARGRVFAPWNIAIFANFIVSASWGMALAQPPARPDYLLVGIGAGMAAALLILAPGTGTRYLITILTGATGVIAAHLMGARSPLLGGLTVLFVGTFYTMLRSGSYRDIKDSAKSLRKFVRRSLNGLWRLIIGGRTWDAAGFRVATAGDPDVSPPAIELVAPRHPAEG